MTDSKAFAINPVIDLVNIPFSRFGSFFVVSKYGDLAENPIYIRDVRRGDLDPGWLFQLEVYDDRDSIVECGIGGTETELILFSGQGAVHIIFPTENTIRIKTDGLFVKLSYVLSRYDTIFSRNDSTWELTSYSKEIRLGIQALEGNVELDAPWESIGNRHISISLKDRCDLVLESFKVVSKHEPGAVEDFDKTRERLTNEYCIWSSLHHLPNERYRKSVALASYITWMNFVQPEGLLKRYAMYMSKNWMTNIWSWDNCFGAIFLAKKEPELSFDQFMFFTDHQHISGMYPDFVNDVYASYSSAKPPIYAWAYQYMMRRNPLFCEADKLMAVYDTLSRFTEFWLNHRSTERGMPFYAHGNESGWDNGTLYSQGVPVVTPDLCALLVHQMDFLATLANTLNKTQESKDWKQRADELFRKMMAELWHDDRFVAKLATTSKIITGGDSLQALMPLIIGERLPIQVKERLLDDLTDSSRFYSEFGLATEAMNSPLYQDNGYWRGPIWAPTMLMYIDMLHHLGETKNAYALAERFVNTIDQNGMAENFDPKTGKGQVDPCFAWTSSVFLTLLDDYPSENER
ncbi:MULTISPECIES: amylo-alpha-1,6-glucosidase [unclassified Fusibacter]|uniref:amylo-alpha-1,6-glucosidase n=1 Tax=unclassified Fusibacter TaxID=2624464 RepID=UPI0010117492|nr:MULTISPECIES: trehalase family glycosidase [unclassified Fusibacter]MCK8061485.1 hypothetical protein [Fusibacter sp. A2]NPE23670.1 hypothetical protein [Fusibacter sp. A1]RXV58849.1 hypothetical protein DWB64_17950 [Fusibacter sp. A1]